MDDRTRLALQEQLAQLEQQFGERLQADLTDLATLAQDLQQTRATASRRLVMLSIRERLHRLAGAAGTFGFAKLGERARQLEQRADRWLDSAKPGSRAAEAFARAVLQLAGETPGQERDGAAELPEHHEEPAPGCRIYLMKADPVAGASMAVTLRNFGYLVSQWPNFAALQAAVADELPDALIVSVQQDSDFDALAALQQGLEQPLPLLVIHDRADFASQLAAVRAGAQGFFVRPLDITQLENSLERCLDRQQGEPFRVLIVDDDAELAARYSLVLRNAQMQVQILTEPTRVLETMRSFNPEVLLLDVNMPDCSGPELAQMIRLHDEWLRVTIIYLSAETDTHRQMAALLKAGDDFITKPISDTALVAAVYSHAQRARSLSTALARDSLTGLLKHADIKEQLALEVQRTTRTGKPASVVMLDLDHFKQINDTYGHAAGDNVIRALANLLRQRLRRIDSLGRYGGEEFVAVLPECSALQARRIFDEIRVRFAALSFNAGDQEFRVTFSAGICETDGHSASGLLLEHADQALYVAKHNGRNQVQIAQR
ncbi:MULTISPECIES: diguanylate cyclase [Stutzerimonas]|jgi:diguanylate cyclase (GGDEF)-like protein|uniref:diguanylate cyclase n=2 Tax=Stutzerimonas TaxID=2901164 RepID=I4CZE2_STUST|nr:MULTISPECIES: diguanylate cyclase [Stutzerimonas]AFM35449.1 two-component response regulator [Stutzerimonas stutzeri CCUG 29243]MCQ2038472.1 diguanylate cyclase [Stutzerimonas kunmingensis]RRV07841.1 diguanylate cyclase [Stutzerimonas xanthomarina]